MKSFWKFENRYYITAVLHAKAGISVGSGSSLMPAGSDLPVIKTPEGLPYIPGSSLKGVVRSYTERLLRTLGEMNYSIKDGKLSACDPLDENSRCVTKEQKKRINDETKNDKEFTARLWEESCTACRLFGSPWISSRVAFQDAPLANIDDMLRIVEVRDGVAIDRDLGTAKSGAKYDFETVPPGAKFSLRIVVENAEEWEVGLLLLALRALKEGFLPVGGKTTRGLGWGELLDLRVQLLTPQNLLEYIQGQEPASVNPEDLERAFLKALEGGTGHA